MENKIIRLTENDLHQIVREAVDAILNDSDAKNHIYSEKEMQWLYDNQGNLTPIQQKVLNGGMWVRAMQANYHGYAEKWPNIAVKNGSVYYYGKDGQLKKVPS